MEEMNLFERRRRRRRSRFVYDTTIIGSRVSELKERLQETEAESNRRQDLLMDSRSTIRTLRHTLETLRTRIKHSKINQLDAALPKLPKHISSRLWKTGIICATCLEVIDDRKNYYVSGCGHEFCKTCISTWGRKNNTCPVCRKIIKTS